MGQIGECQMGDINVLFITFLFFFVGDLYFFYILEFWGWIHEYTKPCFKSSFYVEITEPLFQNDFC